MIGPLGFAIRSLRRRGFHSLLAFLGLTVTVTATTFLLLLGESLASKLGVGFSASVSFGIGWLVSGFLMLSLAFILIVGLLSTSYLVSSMISQRMRDIGVMKAAGSLPNRLFSYAFAEAMLVFAASCLVGGLVALLVYVSWSGSLQLDSVKTLIGLGVPGISFLLSYAAARFQLLKIIKASSVSTISAQLSGLDLRKLGRPVRTKRLGSSFSLASRTLSRDRQFTRTIGRVSVCIFLTMVVLSGALISWDTSKGYLDRAMPSNVTIVGAGPMIAQYSLLAESFSHSASIPQINYLNNSNMIASQLVDVFRGIAGVERVDARLLFFDNVTGYVKAHFSDTGGLSGESGTQDIVPQRYTGMASVLIVGVNASAAIPNWVSSNGFLASDDSNETMIAGDSLLGGIVQMPFNLSQVDWYGRQFDVKSAVVDPLNSGRVLYAPIQTMQNIFGTNGTNLLLVKTDGSAGAVSAVGQLAVQNGLAYESQGPLLSANLAYLDNTWSYLFLLPILTFALTCGILLSYLTTSYSKRFNDYVVLKVLGAKPGYTVRLLFWEAFGTVGICIMIGLPAALLFSTVFLIPDATIQTRNLVSSGVVSALALVGVSLVSTVVYSRRLRLMTVKDLKS